jgi:hypothetical protein
MVGLLDPLVELGGRFVGTKEATFYNLEEEEEAVDGMASLSPRDLPCQSPLPMTLDEGCLAQHIRTLGTANQRHDVLCG